MGEHAARAANRRTRKDAWSMSARARLSDARPRWIWPACSAVFNALACNSQIDAGDAGRLQWDAVPHAR
eukprot:11176062-Lingulodinium_polyedra.AAC.1